MFHQQRERRKTGFDGSYGDWGGRKAIGNSSLYASPEGVELVLHFQEGGEEVQAIQEDWGDQGRGETVAEVGGETLAGRGEAFNRHEGALCNGQPTGEVGVGGQSRGEPVPQPSDFVFGGEVEVVKPDAHCGAGGAFLGGAPVNELSFGYRKGKTLGGRDAAERAEVPLEELDIPSMRGGCYCNHKVVNVGEDQALGNDWVEGGDVYNKQEGGDWGALWSTHGDW